VTQADIKNEARVVKELCDSGGHPNIVEILRDGFETLAFIGEYYFIDMELCDMNLHEYIHDERILIEDPQISRGPTFVSKSCSLLERMRNIWAIMIHISQGLKFLHDHGHAHRDLKPSNGISNFNYANPNSPILKNSKLMEACGFWSFH
jgi:serine/threonine protein kinase